MNTAVLIQNESELNAEQTYGVEYLIITKEKHLISPSLLSAVGRINMKHPSGVTKRDIDRADLLIIVDDNCLVTIANKVMCLIKQFNEKFVVAIYSNPHHKMRWKEYADSAYFTDCDTKKCNFINRLLESIELQGMVCIDFTDVYAQFCKTGHSQFFQGVAIGKYRAIHAIDNAIGQDELSGDTALLVLCSGIDISIDEFELAARYLESKLNKECCINLSAKIRPDALETKQLSVSIFLNKKIGYKTLV
ncbi:hypothetical protein AB4254_20595 [Vibrio breoganii]